MKRSRAFTLVELLVVIAIISLLAGLLLPVLEEALEGAQTVRCLSNKKEVMLATLQYAEDSNGWTFLTDSWALGASWAEPRTSMQAKLINGQYLPGNGQTVTINGCGASSVYSICPVFHCPTTTYTINPAYLQNKPVLFAFRGYYYTFFNLHGPRVRKLTHTDFLAGSGPTVEPLPHSKFVLWADACVHSVWQTGTPSYGSMGDYFNPTGGYVFHMRHSDGVVGTAACADGHVAALGAKDMADYGIAQWRTRLDPP